MSSTIETLRGFVTKPRFAIVNDGKCKLTDTCKVSDDVVVCFDSRKIQDCDVSAGKIHDIKYIFGGTSSLSRLMSIELKGNQLYSRLVGADMKLNAFKRSAKLAKMSAPLDKIIPSSVIDEWLTVRALCIEKLHDKVSSGQSDSYTALVELDERREFIRALHEIELSGIHVDIDFVKQKITETTDRSDLSMLRSMESLQRDGFVSSFFCPVGVKTGRVRIESGFNCMSIPKNGFSRSALTSRHAGGLIYAFDFNAIDYRCIVSHIGGDFAKLYSGYDDFHTRTMRFVFPERHSDVETEKMRRNIIKKISYVYIYGGSRDTLIDKTGLSADIIDRVLKKLDENIKPIQDFRLLLHEDSRRNGHVVMPTGKKISTIENDGTKMHDGKILGLFAQTYSSTIFEKALVRVHNVLKQTKSSIMFPLHDEIVIDMHPDDVDSGVADEIRSAMQKDGFVVKMKSGKSYGSLE